MGLAPFVAVLAVLLVGEEGSRTSARETFDTESSTFSLAFQGETSAYRDRSAFALPGTAVDFEVVGGPPGEYGLKAGDGTAIQRTLRKWRWTAPGRPGLYDLKFTGPADDDTVTVHAFVLVPASEVRNGVLNGYRIGQYPPPLKGNPIYRAPSGFVEVTKETERTKVSPHFRLSQFVCKQESASRFPKYLVLKERLLLKLEAILEQVNALGVDADTLHVMSAYRTPFYNHAIGDVRYSMHQFGSAADIYVDTVHDDQMDDLNRDGKVDRLDAQFLNDLIERLMARPSFRHFEGGMGVYPATPAHPPFVHVDVRGARARWTG